MHVQHWQRRGQTFSQHWQRLVPLKAALAMVLATAALADDGINVAHPDRDFYIQGEYAGHLCSAGGHAASYGLQVVALGDGRFGGVLVPGGLPGNGGNWQARQPVAGQWAGEKVLLEGGQLRWHIASLHAQARNERDHVLGTLPKVARGSPTEGAQPPAGALVLFDGGSTERFESAKMARRLLLAGADTKQSFADMTLHLEFQTPYMPRARGQARGNSGVYIQRRYEVQILDSFGLAGQDNECGALYKARAPALNMCFPPARWQTYDISFKAARFDAAGTKTAPARITVRHNGVLVHDDAPLASKTGGGEAESPLARPLRLQDHGNPVLFRNVWLVEEADLRATPACNLPGQHAKALDGAEGRQFDRALGSVSAKMFGQPARISWIGLPSATAWGRSSPSANVVAGATPSAW